MIFKRSNPKLKATSSFIIKVDSPNKILFADFVLNIPCGCNQVPWGGGLWSIRTVVSIRNLNFKQRYLYNLHILMEKVLSRVYIASKRYHLLFKHFNLLSVFTWSKSIILWWSKWYALAVMVLDTGYYLQNTLNTTRW